MKSIKRTLVSKMFNPAWNKSVPDYKCSSAQWVLDVHPSVMKILFPFFCTIVAFGAYASEGGVFMGVLSVLMMVLTCLAISVEMKMLASTVFIDTAEAAREDMKDAVNIINEAQQLLRAEYDKEDEGRRWCE